MNLESKYFDRIRVKPEEDRLLRDRVPTCEWPGCEGLGKHPAPKGRESEGDYHYFCVEHVRRYNKQYNYFSGMRDPEIEDWRKQSETGHRPTWRLGQNSWATHNRGRFASRKLTAEDDHRDPFDLLNEKAKARQPQRPSRRPRNAEMKALHTLGLDETATAETIKLQYKTLVKRLHPDANGGSRANEDKLREIIQAYDYLRKAGYC